MIRAVAVALWLVSSVAFARDPGEGGVAIEQSDGAVIETNASRLIFQTGDIDCQAQSTGDVLCQLGANATELGSTISDTDFADPTVMPYAVIGGTLATSSLDLRPNNNANPTTGTIELCAGPADSNTSTFSCLTAFPDGWTMGPNGGATGSVSVLSFSSTVTQDSTGLFGFPISTVFSDTHIHDVTAGTSGASIFAFAASPTYKNATANAVAGGAAVVAYYTSPTISNTGAGSLTIAEETGLSVGVGGHSAGTTVTDKYGVKVAATVTSGTITDNYGVFVAAQTAGTNIFPYGAGEHTITGTVNSGEGIWGVESGSPNRFYFKNESGHIWRTGWATWSMSSALLGADNGTDYFRPVGFGQAAGTAEATVDEPVQPGPMKVYGMACNARVAPANGGGTQTRTCTLRVGTPGSLLASTLSCSFSEATQSCTDRDETGVAISATQVADIEWTASGTPADSEVAVTLWWNLDAF